jgi:hypothetical protein
MYRYAVETAEILDGDTALGCSVLRIGEEYVDVKKRTIWTPHKIA